MGPPVKPVPYHFWSVGIVVPAQNEEDTIEACIESIQASCRQAELREYRIAVVADSCTDLTARRARRVLGEAGELLECEVGSAGAARRAGVEAILKYFKSRAPSQIWLANTDADTTVPPDWISLQLKLADAGVSGVAGIVQLDPNGAAAAQEVYRRTYLTNRDGSHSHVHGANLSMRADAYIDAGGWSERPLAEDHCLWQRLKRRGWRVCSTVQSVVITSARLEGRASGGFADTLRATIEAASADA
jgi:cellulose synthase/poly-beta-1,6-N-acetylglucosamine synthase-like glycosyltransferase